jgi:iron complex outermembrane receptor protein
VNQSFFIEDKLRVGPQTTWVGALQYDRANRKVTDTLSAANNSDHTFAQWSPRLGVVHELTSQAQVFASVSQNFEAPLFGLTGTTTAANQAQTGTTWEAGTRGEWRHASHHLGWDATYYRANLRHEFQSVCA